MTYRLALGNYTFAFTIAKRKPPTRMERVRIAISDLTTTVRNRDVAQRVVNRVNHVRELAERAQSGISSMFRKTNCTVNGVTYINVQFK